MTDEKTTNRMRSATDKLVGALDSATIAIGSPLSTTSLLIGAHSTAIRTANRLSEIGLKIRTGKLDISKRRDDS